ncbi:hypothetical protein LOD99_15267 [Oopsacas minuta]|uniref:Rho-GAP domain-containing protein n=1 Tax=Oopsacas minuta TaxID=111878 RepID=A0AAV7KBC4_9METZ|nr:hypothetical protein LOD99_15267 [Oopsacas minuta]
MSQTNDTKFLSELSPEHLLILQQLNTHRLESMDITTGQICTPKPPGAPKKGYKRLSMRRSKPVSQVFGRNLTKISTSYVKTSILDNHIAFKEWLQSEQDEPSLTDTDSIPAFVRNTPLRRSCPGRARGTLQRRPHTNSSLSIADLEFGEEAQRTGAPLPCFALEAVRHIVACGLRAEGVFRKSGSHVRMRQLREQWESGIMSDLQARDQLPGHYRFSIELHRTHDIAGLLKEFLRELPEPLLTRELLPTFLSLSDSTTPILPALRGLVCLLPERNRCLLQLLLFLCSEVLENSQFNKMDTHSLATVLAPGMLPNLTNQKDFTLASVSVVRQLIEASNDLFSVSESDWSILNLKSILLSNTNENSPLSASCQYPSPSPLLASESYEFGGRVKRFFKRALLSPFDSPNSVPKLKLGRIPNTDMSTGLYRSNNIGVIHCSDNSISSSPDSFRERSRTYGELKLRVSDRERISPGLIHPRLLTGPPLIFSPSENIMRINSTSKRQFIIRPINSSPLNDIGPNPKILTTNIHPEINRDIPKPFSKYTTHVTYNKLPLKPLHTSQIENTRYISSPASQSNDHLFDIKKITVLTDN